MKAKHQRMSMIIGALIIMCGAATVILTTFKDNLLFFVTPSQLHEKLASGEIAPYQRMRLGGLVEKDSVSQIAPGMLTFRLTDMETAQGVRYSGIVPALFREGQGAVVEGAIEENGMFVGTKLLAKHDENYMPAEVANALKESGKWQHYGTKPDGEAISAPYVKDQK